MARIEVHLPIRKKELIFFVFLCFNTLFFYSFSDFTDFSSFMGIYPIVRYMARIEVHLPIRKKELIFFVSSSSF